MPTTTALHTSSASLLVVHFDINETILVGDQAGGDTRDDCFHKMVAKSAFVRAKKKGDDTLQRPTHWWDGTLIKETYVESDTVPALHTAWKWPEGCVPYYRTAYKKRAKTFCDHHGSIYRGIYDKLHECMKGKHLLPAFFETLVQLSASNENVSICFRTMGTDLPAIAQAVSEFASGKHPDYPNFKNEKLVLAEDGLVRGRWVAQQQQQQEQQNQSGDNNTNDYVYQLFGTNGQCVAAGDAAVLEYIHSHSVCGIQDDYDHWSRHNNEPWAGKPVWKPFDKRYHHVMFDDNMYVTRMTYDLDAKRSIGCCEV